MATDKVELFKKIDRIVFDTLAARRSVTIKGLGQIMVVMTASKTKSAGYVPHYKLILTPDREDDVVLYDEVKKLIHAYNPSENTIWDEWYSRCSRNSESIHFFEIQNVISVVNSSKDTIITPSKELNIQLNPFALIEKKRSKGLIWSGRIAILAIGFIVYFGLDILKDTKRIENTPVVGQAPHKYQNYVDNETDTKEEKELLSQVTNKDNTPDSTLNQELPEPIVNISKEVAKDTFYVVVGSYKTRKQALYDVKLKQKTFKNTKIGTAKKSTGFFNYIYVSDKEKSAIFFRDSIQPIYSRVKGIWVYKKEC